MKKVTLFIIILVAGIATGQTNYQKGMQKGFQLWEQGKTVEAFNVFERISKAEPNNWLPMYYAAQVHITQSFGEKDVTKLQSQLDRAQELIDSAFSISENNVELLVLQAMLHTVWVSYDGATYGPKLSGTIYGLYGKAIQMAPKNPRVVLSKAEWDMGAARYFGKDPKSFCKDIDKAIELFATFEQETPFHPNWGKDRALEASKYCKS